MRAGLAHSFGFFVCVITAQAAMAAPADFLDGAYGNKEGCLYATTGESSGADFFFLLTNEAITSAASYCAFKAPVTKRGSAFSATVSCQEEGMEGETHQEVAVNRVGAAYTIVFKDGSTWGPLDKCK